MTSIEEHRAVGIHCTTVSVDFVGLHPNDTALIKLEETTWIRHAGSKAVNMAKPFKAVGCYREQVQTWPGK